MGSFSDSFRGFLLQGRAYADDSVVGTFMTPPPGSLYRLSNCERRNVSLLKVSNFKILHVYEYVCSVHIRYVCPHISCGI